MLCQGNRTRESTTDDSHDGKQEHNGRVYGVLRDGGAPRASGMRAPVPLPVCAHDSARAGALLREPHEQAGLGLRRPRSGYCSVLADRIHSSTVGWLAARAGPGDRDQHHDLDDDDHHHLGQDQAHGPDGVSSGPTHIAAMLRPSLRSAALPAVRPQSAPPSMRTASLPRRAQAQAQTQARAQTLTHTPLLRPCVPGVGFGMARHLSTSCAARDVSRLTLVGRVAGVSPARTTANGSEFLAYTVATHDPLISPDQPPTSTFHRIYAFGNRSVEKANRLAKGDLVYVEADLRIERAFNPDSQVSTERVLTAHRTLLIFRFSLRGCRSRLLALACPSFRWSIPMCPFSTLLDTSPPLLPPQKQVERRGFIWTTQLTALLFSFSRGGGGHVWMEQVI